LARATLEISQSSRMRTRAMISTISEKNSKTLKIFQGKHSKLVIDQKGPFINGGISSSNTFYSPSL